MRNMLYVVLFAAYVAALQASSQGFVLHERRALHDPIALDRSRIDPHVLLPMRIGLHQNQEALAAADGWLMDVSDPDSPNYGQHWKQEEVIAAFQPSDQTVLAVSKWLHSYNIFNFTHTDNKLWLAFDIPASTAEAMFQTQYFEHQTPKSLAFEASCDEYYLPEGIKEHIDFIMPGVTSAIITRRTARSRKVLDDHFSSRRSVRSNRNSERLAERTSDLPSVGKNNLTCGDDGVTAACIRAMYNIPLADPNLPISPINSMGIFEAFHTTYNQASLDAYYKQFTDVPVGTEPFFIPVDGGAYAPNHTHGPQWIWEEIEGDLDVEMSQPIVYPQNVTMWDLRRAKEDYYPKGNNYFNRILDAIDGSYCTNEQRANSSEGGKPRCGVFKPTNVISYSYSTTEFFGPARFWRTRQCNEYLKLGLQGVSVFFSSGDSGVWNFAGVPLNYTINCTTAATGRNGPTGPRLFQVAFPGACPYVTVVGGTRIKYGDTVGHREIGWRHGGGGFSDLWERPPYQNSAIEHWFRTTNSTIPYYYNGDWRNSTDGRYNRNGRGLPDLSAVAENVWTYTHGGKKLERDGGTSYATPIVAAIFNRINEERLRAGKGTVGFVNPTIYKNPQAFTDILDGYNGNICTGPLNGFYCDVGWDPVTGLGTPDYPKLLEAFMKLP